MLTREELVYKCHTESGLEGIFSLQRLNEIIMKEMLLFEGSAY